MITQNIDGLHQKAGSRTVYELHGSVYRNRCLRCGRQYGPEVILSVSGVPRCADCGGVLKPEVTLYEEMLDAATRVGRSKRGAGRSVPHRRHLAGPYIRRRGLPCNVGIGRASSSIGRPTAFDDLATLAIHADLGEVFSQIGGEEEGE